MKRILLIEDDFDIAANIQDYLERNGYGVTYASNGALGLHFALSEVFDLVLLDIRMPGIDGLSVCQQLRSRLHLNWPVLMLTAADSLSDRLGGFRSGTDDYVVKPFALEEILVRIEALLRRSSGVVSTNKLSAGDLVLDLDRRQAQREGKPLALTNIGFQILKILCEQHPRIVSRQDLESAIWGDEPPSSDSLRSHIFAVRNELDKPFSRAMLSTRRGVGYCLETE